MFTDKLVAVEESQKEAVVESVLRETTLPITTTTASTVETTNNNNVPEGKMEIPDGAPAPTMDVADLDFVTFLEITTEPHWISFKRELADAHHKWKDTMQ